MEILASSLAIATATVQASKSSKGCYDDYRFADKQMLHVERQKQQLHLNRAQLNQLPPTEKERIRPVFASLEDAKSSVPTVPRPCRKRDRLKWVAGGKSETEREITQNHRAESSLALSLLLSLGQDLEKIAKESEVRHKENEANLQLLQSVVYAYGIVSKSKIRKYSPAKIYKLDWLAKMLGIELGLIVSRTEHHIKACKAGDIKCIRDLLSAKTVHPNDKTPDNMTVFRHAIHTGDSAIVRLLLDYGADPNLPYGKFESCPLHSAFMSGHVEIIRLLLHAKAELGYKNQRAYTCVGFLWDPEQPTPTHPNEIMDVVNLNMSDAWNDVDLDGWTPCHRAGAYGSGEDIRALDTKGINLHMYTTWCLWGPMTVAVWHNNNSTFDAFMDLFPTEEILNIKDARGWTLLHMAAQRGNEHIMRRLLDAGADTTLKTVGTNEWIYERFKWKCLTAEENAREYGYGNLWDRLTHIADPEVEATA